MRVYVNGIDCGEGRIKKGKKLIEVMYKDAKYPTCYPTNRCIFSTRFGKKCMIFGGDYSEEDITEINKQYSEWLYNKKG